MTLSLTNSYPPTQRAKLLQYTPATHVKSQLIAFVDISRRRRNTESPRIVSSLLCSLSLAYPFIVDDLLEELERKMYPPYHVDDIDTTECLTPFVEHSENSEIIADDFIWNYTLFLDLCATEFPSMEKATSTFSPPPSSSSSSEQSSFVTSDQNRIKGSKILQKSSVPQPTKPSSKLAPAKLVIDKLLLLYNEAYKLSAANYSRTIVKKKQMLNNILNYLIGRLKESETKETGESHDLCCSILYPLSIYSTYSPFISEYICGSGLPFIIKLGYLCPSQISRELVGRIIRSSIMRKDNVHEKNMVRNVVKKKEGKREFVQYEDIFDRLHEEVVEDPFDVFNVLDHPGEIYEPWKPTYYYSSISAKCIIPPLLTSVIIYELLKEKDKPDLCGKFEFGKPYISTKTFIFKVLSTPILALPLKSIFNKLKENIRNATSEQLACAAAIRLSLTPQQLPLLTPNQKKGGWMIGVPFQVKELPQLEVTKDEDEMKFLYKKDKDDSKNPDKEEEKSEGDDTDEGDDNDSGEEGAKSL
jgi:hypothetical protein